MSGGQTETVNFPTLQAFQEWYGGVLTTSAPDAFVNVPIGDLDGEYLVVRPNGVIGIHVEPKFNALDE
jgi:hypothetical protein